MNDRIKIKHVDGKTDVYAKIASIGQHDINLEYKLGGITWGRSIEFIEAVRLYIVECPHPNMNPILGYENSQIGEQCTLCGKLTLFNPNFMLPWKKVSEIEPPMTERLLLLQADGLIEFGNYCEVGKGKYLGMGKWTKHEKQFINEADEQPGQIYPEYYILESEIPKPY